MKKILLILSIAFCGIANAQYTTVLDFNGTNGEQPHGTIISDGTFLYGMAYYGGTANAGLIFKIKPDGSGYDTLLNFKGPNGAFPTGSLISDGTFFYGMTSNGGAGSQGIVFKIKPDGTGYTDLLDFTGSANGGHPQGDLISDGTFLYGMTGQGGSGGSGTVFKIMPDGTGFATLHNFGSTAYDGNWPMGSLFFDGTFLYGMTNQGGTTGRGIIFKILPDGTGYTNMYTLGSTAFDGSYPEGSLISDGTYLYGVAHWGGVGNGGVVFKIKPDGTGYDTLVSFKGTNGCTPVSSLISDGTFLYGTTSDGGTGTCNNGHGTIYKVKPDGTGFSKMFNFTGALNGDHPQGSLYSDGSFLYGTAYGGGANGDGVLFKFYPISVSVEQVGNPICSNQCNASASASVLNGTPPYTYSWSTNPVQTAAIASNLCAGTTYTVTVTDSIGSASDTITIAALPSTLQPSICAVTVDSLSEYNIIVWDKTPYIGGGVDSFIVYREITTNNYQPIGEVPFDSLSMFIDTLRTQYFPNTGNPNNGTYRYKLMAHDTCGLFSEMSLYHNTIYINNSSGTFSWNLYTIESTSNPVTGYTLLRDDNNSGNWQTVAGVSGTQQTVTDPQYATYQNTAAWRVQTQWGITCSPTVKNTSGNIINLNSSQSNIYRANGAGIEEKNNAADLISIYPNPAKEFVIIDYPVSSKDYPSAGIYAINGKLLQSINITQMQTEVNISDLPAGIYLIKVTGADSASVKILAKE
jgi:uncharacterized repeat protein (TIGR03803 family)